jgi:hypothetical protein
VTAFSSQFGKGTESFPQTVQNLTANMNAGIMSGLYTGSQPASDPVDCSSQGCSFPPCLQPTSCSLMQINSGHEGFFLASQFAAQVLAVRFCTVCGKDSVPLPNWEENAVTTEVSPTGITA